MTLFLFFTACISILILAIGYLPLGINGMNNYIMIGWSGIVFILYVIVFLCIFYVIRFAMTGIKRIYLSGRPHKIVKITGPASLQRRSFIKKTVHLGILATTSLIVFRGAANGMQHPCVKAVPVPVKNLHNALKNFRIVQLSDLHIDGSTKADWVSFIVDTVNRLDPDIIVLTGDLADASVKKLRPVVALLTDLSSKHGCFFVTGNHEYGISAGGVESWIREIDRIGFKVLMNEHQSLSIGKGTLLIAGVPDYDAGLSLPFTLPDHYSDPQESMKTAQPADFKILLAHQPKTVFQAAKVGFDLQISGHTHGGQIFPGHILTRITQPFLSGLHTLDNTQIYVSCGTGDWGPPLRLLAPAEISFSG